MNELLKRSYRGVFPFRIGTTSYIYPDHVLPNARMLAPYLDEIELVLFESAGQDNLPSRQDIEELVLLSRDTGIGYNVHLPIDVFLGEADASVRERGASSMQHIISLTEPLRPESYTIHFELDDTCRENHERLDAWKGNLRRSMEHILRAGVEPSRMAVETLHYPFEMVEDIVEDYQLSVCLDFGHLISKGYSLSHYTDRYIEKTSVVHLHGVSESKDHLSLGVMESHELRIMGDLLRDFSGVVSIEVFSFADLETSLRLFAGVFEEEAAHH